MNGSERERTNRERPTGTYVQTLHPTPRHLGCQSAEGTQQMHHDSLLAHCMYQTVNRKEKHQ